MKLITFINLANVDFFLKSKYYKYFDTIHSDGFLLTFLYNFYSKNKIERKSFDFSSLGKETIEKNLNKKIFFCGGKKNEINSFQKNLTKKYNNAVNKNFFFLNGYSDKNAIINFINKIKPEIIILSLGSGLQEDIAIEIRKKIKYNKVTVYTSGAFITQSSNDINYYPKIINKYNLRWLYRAISNKHVRERLIFDYPKYF